MPDIQMIKGIILILLLIPVIIIDFKKHIIPNSIIIIGLILGIAFIFLDNHSNKTYLLGALFGLLIFVAIIIFSELILKKQGMGEGDAKLMCVVGLFLGLSQTILTVFLSFIIASIYSIILMITKKVNGGYEVAFGPFISIAAIISMFFGTRLIYWYMNILV